MLVDFRPYYYYYTLIFMTVATLAGQKIGVQKIKCNKLLLLDKSHKFQNLYKVNIYSKTIKYCSWSYTLCSWITTPPLPGLFFSKRFQPTTVIRNHMVIITIIENYDNYRNREWRWLDSFLARRILLVESYSTVTQPRDVFYKFLIWNKMLIAEVV